MNLTEILREECIATGLTLSSKAEVLRKVAEVAKQSPVLEAISAGTILRALEEREELGSTGFGNAIAIPHCRLEGISEFVVGILTAPHGVDFGAIDEQPVRVIVFIIAPADGSSEHIKVLSAISNALRIPETVPELLRATSAEAAREGLLRHTRISDEQRERNPQHLFHVLVQDDNVFREILEVMVSAGASSLAIVKAENATAYLAKMPLFAAFWHEDTHKYLTLIVALIDKNLTNETLRAIEGITGDLDAQSGVLVTVQEVFYSAGALGMHV